MTPLTPVRAPSVEHIASNFKPHRKDSVQEPQAFEAQLCGMSLVFLQRGNFQKPYGFMWCGSWRARSRSLPLLIIPDSSPLHIFGPFLLLPLSSSAFLLLLTAFLSSLSLSLELTVSLSFCLYAFAAKRMCGIRMLY